MKWEPANVIRLAALGGGFLLCGLGSLLVWLGVGVEGIVDIKSAVLSGTVETGSAGLFILFLGVAIILFVLATLTAQAAANAVPQQHRKSRSRAIGGAFSALALAMVISGFLGAVGYGGGFGILALALRFFVMFAGVAYVESKDD